MCWQFVFTCLFCQAPDALTRGRENGDKPQQQVSTIWKYSPLGRLLPSLINTPAQAFSELCEQISVIRLHLDRFTALVKMLPTSASIDLSPFTGENVVCAAHLVTSLPLDWQTGASMVQRNIGCIYIYANLLVYCAIMFLNEVLEGSCSSIFIIIIISRVDVAQVLGDMLIF